MPRIARQCEPIVITGIGLITSVGNDRESVWAAVRQGRSGVRRLEGLPGIPDGLLIGAPVTLEGDRPNRLKAITLADHAATEAIDDSGVDLESIDRDRFGCAIAGHMGDTGFVNERLEILRPTGENVVPWWQQ
ncbi:MAG TPA: beta-ketoacyl synthase N-terminal-like domain-containing protein, partial [Pirellulales bacterium]|nr:beta-ketoacyl synthase N-terminal-like domain-containing protein [Pirellulales bacterium]